MPRANDENRWLLIAPPAVACVVDVAMTLAGQPAAYWSGSRSTVREFNPVARMLLEAHPLAFPIAALAGLLVLSMILLRWQNRRLAYVLAFVVTFVQSVAAAGWMIRHGPIGWAGAAVTLIVAERLTALVRPRVERVLTHGRTLQASR